MPTLCPCGSNLPLPACCGPILLGKAKAKTAESLMRSRYTAYTQGNIAYIRKTQSAAINATFSTQESKRWAKSTSWLGLEIHETIAGTETDHEGWVTFTAHYKDSEGKQTLHEKSHFTKNEKGWIYEKS